MDLIIHNGIVVTVNADFDIIENGFVGISDGKIKAIGQAEGTILTEAKKTLNAKGGIILPGLVNTHSHLPMTLFRGLADDLPLMDWLNHYIFPAEATHIHPETVELGALLGCAEMMLSGTTTCCDGYFHEDGVARAVLSAGMRAVVGQGVIDFPAPGVPDPSLNVKTAELFLKNWSGASNLLYPSIFCHSPYTCSKDTLKMAKETAGRHDALFQIHVAETKSEVDQIYAEHRESPVAYLDEMGIMDSKTLLVHCVWVDDKDIAAIQTAKSGISINTESHMKLASGVAPISQFLKSGITVGLGTDGCASNNDLDLFSEMDMTAKLHKVNTLDPTVMNAETVLKMATIGGAKAVGLGDVIGSIEVGKQADIIVLDTAKPHLTPLYHPVSHIVYAACGGDVSHVFVAGKQLVADGRLLSMDIQAVMKDVNGLSKTIKKNH